MNNVQPLSPLCVVETSPPLCVVDPPPPLCVVDPFPIELDRVVDAQKLGIDGVYPTLNPRQGSFLLFPLPLHYAYTTTARVML